MRDLQDDCLLLIKFAGFTKQVPKPFTFGAAHMGVTVAEFEDIWDRVRPVFEQALGWRFEEDTDRIKLRSPAPKGGPQLQAEQQALIKYLRNRETS